MTMQKAESLNPYSNGIRIELAGAQVYIRGGWAS